MAELADAPDLGSGTRKGMGVRVPPFALRNQEPGTWKKAVVPSSTFPVPCSCSGFALSVRSFSVNPDVFTIREAAAYLRVGPKVVRRLCKLKRIRHQVPDRKGTVRIV